MPQDYFPSRHRGVFFTVMAVLMLAPIMALAMFHLSALREDASGATLKIRGGQLSAFAESAELDISRFMAISSRNALIALVKYEEDNNATVANASCILEALAYYGNATNSSCSGTTLVANISLPTPNSYLLYWVNRTLQWGARFGFNASIEIQNHSFNQSGGFNASYSLVLLANATEKTGLMNVSRRKAIAITVPITGLDDPIYLSSTQGLIRRSINDTANYSGAQNLAAFIAGKYYAPSASGPSFFDRLEGSLVLSGKYGNDTGIETFANVPQLEANGIPAKNQSALDYHYFNASLAAGLGCNVQELSCADYWWFKIDGATAAKYGVTQNCTKCG
ncbi:MAG: hypothetical protein WC792_00565 [Candidatus Micrarchaeia archaeon]|jgi:hypothetical protein